MLPTDPAQNMNCHKVYDFSEGEPGRCSRDAKCNAHSKPYATQLWRFTSWGKQIPHESILCQENQHTWEGRIAMEESIRRMKLNEHMGSTGADFVVAFDPVPESEILAPDSGPLCSIRT
jgi:hypothetical protein